MAKQTTKIYLEPQELKDLQAKAKNAGFDGKGFLSHWLAHISKYPFITCTDDVQTILKMMQVK